jgi:glc operon protein GlcG
MRLFVAFAVAISGVVLIGSAVQAQPQPAPAAPPPGPPPAYGPAVTTDQAKKAVAAAIAAAKKTPYFYAFAVVDPTGSLVYFEKMENAPYASTNIAMAKARTAASFKLPTKVWFDRMETGHPYVATLEPGLVAAAGGIPLMVDGKVVGAIGVSGGPTGLIDTDAAQAGVDALK